MESDHRHAGYKPAALPLSYVPGCPDLSTTRDQDGGFIISYMRKIRMRKENRTSWIFPIRSWYTITSLKRTYRTKRTNFNFFQKIF